ncbi:MAG: restriction endonuclease [Pseudomonadota bacterium]
MADSFQIDAASFPDLPAMMFATLEALRDLGGSATIHEIDDQVAETENVTDEEQSYLMKGDRRPRFNYYMAWARTYLKRGGTIENSQRGIWSLKSRHEEIATVDDTREIHAKVNEEERARAREKRQRNNEVGSDNRGDSSALTEPNGDSDDWREVLLSVLQSMEPDAFERLSQRLLREAGFVKVEVRGKTGDGGIDGVGVLRVNLVSFQIYFQCKRWKGSVGSKEIRDFRGAVQGRADKGLFITTGTFTTSASEEAVRDGAIAIDLIDGERLCELLQKYELGVTTTLIERVQVESVWFNQF